MRRQVLGARLSNISLSFCSRKNMSPRQASIKTSAMPYHSSAFKMQGEELKTVHSVTHRVKGVIKLTKRKGI